VTDLPGTADVVVIGGGIVGCAAAYELAAANAGRVLLLEREDAVGRGSTGACAGGFRHQFTTEVNVRLSQASVPLITGFTETHGLPLDVRQDGYLFLVRDEASWESFRDGVVLQRSLGVEVEVLDAAGAAALVRGLDPGGIVGATFGPRDGIADPAGLTQGYELLARRTGVEVRTGCTVTALLADDREVSGVRTATGDVVAPAVVLAAGAWSGPIAATAGVDLPVEPVPRTIVTTGGFPGAPERRTLVVDADSSFYFHREADGVLMGMAGDDRSTFDTTVDRAFVEERLLPRAVAVFPPLEEAGVRGAWAGLYEMTPDRHPVVGPGPLEGLWIAAGFSGHGFQHGPIVGRLVAEMIVEGAARSVDVRSLGIDRFARGELVREAHVV
jgi:sarcosine oxidase subunit beta